MRKFSIALIVLLCCALPAYRSLGQGTAFNYQGQLNTTNGAANGNYDFQFALYAGSSGGSPTTPMVTNSAVAVANGFFTTAINFGFDAFTGSPSWLDIAVRTSGASSFTELTPRQQILPVPYAIYAASASNAVNAVYASTANNANSANSAVTASTASVANSLAANAIISGASIAAGSLIAADFAPGQIVTNLNGLTGGITLAVSNNLTLTTNGNTLTIGGGSDFLYAYLFGQSQSVTSSGAPSGIIPVSTITTNGWGWNKSFTAPVFYVPDTGFYLIHFDALPSTSYPAIGAYYSVGNGSYSALPGSLGSGSPLSHSFIAPLVAGDNLVFANTSGGTLQLLSNLSGANSATLFSVSIIRIN
jgi:hypothetical protein